MNSCGGQRQPPRPAIICTTTLQFFREDSLPSIVLFHRPYSWSEVIHRAGDESIFSAFERERPRIVNNFAASASPGYEFSSSSEKMNGSRLSNLVIVLESATNTQTRTNRL